MNDCELVKAVLQGEREAFSQLVGRYQGYVYGLCLRMTLRPSDAEELAHEAFVEAYLKLGQLRELPRFRPWLRQIALNLCRAWWRQRRDLLVLPADAAAKPAREEPEGVGRLTLGMTRLSPPHRLVLTLHYLEGLDYRQIATFLAVPVGTVMSRLHRARIALRRQVDGLGEQEDVPVIPNEQFRRQVDAEVDVLLSVFGGRPEEAERLSVVLSRTPERLGQLLREADGEKLTRLAVLLPRLGAAGADVALGCAVSDDDTEARVPAAALLRIAVRRMQSFQRGGLRNMAPLELYVMADRLIAIGAPTSRQARLVADLLDGATDAPTAALLTCLLLCSPDEAFALLWERFTAARERGEISVPWVLFALCRYGNRLCVAIAEALHSSGPDEPTLALAEALGRCVRERAWLQDVSGEHLDYERRTRWALPPLRHRDLDAEALRPMTEAVAACVTQEQPGIRDRAISALGGLRAVEHLGRLRRAAAHEDVATRRAALLALVEFGDDAPRELFRRAAEHGEPPERYAALEALGRLQARETLPLLIRLADDADPQAAELALVAIGEIGGHDAERVLHGQLRSGDKRRRKVAAKALYRRPGDDRKRPTRPHRVRGQAQPFTYVSLHAAIRYATPELQEYEELQLTAGIARVCVDYALARRNLVDSRLMARSEGIYRFTELGEAVWRVEHYLMDHYLA